MKRFRRKRSLLTPIVGIVALLLVSCVVYLKIHADAPAGLKTSDTQSVADVQSQGTTKPTAHTDTGLQAIVETWAAQYPYDTAVVVQELDGDLRGASHRPTNQMITASTYKIYVAYAVLHQIEQGAYSLNTVTRSGQTVSTALERMILQSDNVSAEALGFLVGWDRINQLVAAAGATQTDINNYSSAGLPVDGSKLSTATDLTTIVTKLQRGDRKSVV